jgi:Rieske Fe-S protein
MNTIENFPDVENTTNNPPRREFLVQAASMLGLTVSAGAAITLVDACTPTTPTQPNTGTGGTGGTGTGGGMTSPDNIITIAQEPNLQAVGGAVIKTVSSNPVVIIRTGASEFLVLSALCTHAACTVELPSGGVIMCMCHGSRFSASDGRVLNGPAGTPLRKITAMFDAMKNTLTITV